MSDPPSVPDKLQSHLPPPSPAVRTEKKTANNCYKSGVMISEQDLEKLYNALLLRPIIIHQRGEESFSHHLTRQYSQFLAFFLQT